VPEVLEVESYRRLAERTVGWTITKGWADAYSAKKLPSVGTWARAVKGLRITGTDRRGKMLILTTTGPRLGFRFGMTGVLLLDSVAGVEGLMYGPHDFDRKWVRGGLAFSGGHTLVLHDPRRLARFEIDPDLTEMGPDVLGLTRRQFDDALTPARGEGPAIKARLLDQSAVAGIGNLLADEMLFRAGLDPRTPSGTLNIDQRGRLFRALKGTLRHLGQRGGSHLGDHMEARHPGAPCPLDGATLLVATIGGRTTYWCPQHQH
jgi:formamidopyrimidine-DNA glycosylase